MPIEEPCLVGIPITLFYSTRMHPVLQRDATSYKSKKERRNLYVMTLLPFQRVNVTMINIGKNFELLYTLQRSIGICSIREKHQPYIQIISRSSPFSIQTIMKIFKRAWMRSCIFLTSVLFPLKENVIRLQIDYREYYSIHPTVHLII